MKTNDIPASIQALDAVLDDDKRQRQQLHDRYPAEKLPRAEFERYNAEKKHIEEASGKRYKTLEQERKTLIAEVHRIQSPLETLDAGAINTGTAFPSLLSFGRIRVVAENDRTFMPRLIEFPLRQPIWFPSTKSSVRMIHALLLRLLHSVPTGKLELYATDPRQLGQAFEQFKSLLSVKALFPDERILTNADEIEAMLAHQADYIERLIQNTFVGTVKNWSAFNALHQDNPLPYKVVMLVSIPEQITDKSAVYMERLLRHGPTCGVLPLLLVDVAQCTESNTKKYETLFSKITEHTVVHNQLAPVTLKHLKTLEEEEQFPDEARLSTFIAAVKKRYDEAAKVVRGVAGLFKDVVFWSGDSTEGIAAPIGWDERGALVLLTLNDAPPHGLLAGKTGSGKSNLLHIIIQSLCYVYPPDEMRLYLLDFKEGVEFNLYSAPPLPHARLVATSRDVEYGIKVLTHVLDEMKERYADFKTQNVKDFIEYRQKIGTMPRVLVIIDEFQVMFADKRAEDCFNELLRQGRSAGIHLLLATQTIRGIQATSMSQLTANIGCRIALNCSEEDSATILAMDNREAAKLELKKQAIINIENGQKSGNHIFIHPKAEPDIGKKNVERFAEEAQKRGFVADTKVYRGAEKAAMPETIDIEKTEGLTLEVGVQIDFDTQPFRIVLPNSAGGNLLIIGVSEPIHRGLLAAIRKSADGQVDEIILYDTNTDLAAIRQNLGAGRRLIIVETLEDKKELYPPSPFVPKKENTPTPAEHFKAILDECPQNGTYTVALCKNWGRVSTQCKNHLPSFELRVGYNLQAAQAGAVFSEPTGVKGLDREDRAMFQYNTQRVLFQPYSEQEI
jgi:hypothetical protein